MKRYEAILAIVPAQAVLTPAIKRAVELAGASGATLHLCIFEYDSAVDFAAARAGSDVADHVRHDIVRDREESLQRLAASLAGKGHAVECDVVWAPDQAKAVLAKALEINAQAVLKDAHHESTLRRAVYTPLDWKLMRLLPCELMLVGPASHPLPKRVAAAVDVLAEPVDADGLNKRILAVALQLSEYLGARLDLVSVFPHFPTLHHRAWPGSEAMYAEANTEHYEAFRKFAEAHSIPQDRRHRLKGLPTVELGSFVSDNGIDVLVMGTQYRSRWERLLLGSTAESLAQEVNADLVLVKPPGFADTLRGGITL
ncbi:MAG TPA: universal stress protein [Nevskia sp.]|nr:universal stress protein [Nevskia sp.]